MAVLFMGSGTWQRLAEALDWLWQAMAGMAGVVVSGRPRGSVKRVSGKRPKVAKVLVVGGGGSEGGESRRSAREEMTQWQGVSELAS